MRAASMQLWFEVQSFLFFEARLQDDRRFAEWAELFTDDARYWMPIITNKIGRDVGKEWTMPDELSHFEEDKTSLINRVKRLATGMAWAETPPSRTRHMVTNIEVNIDDDDGGSVAVRSNFLIYRSHLEYDVEIFSGRRDDKLRKLEVLEGDAAQPWRIAQRVVVLDQAVITQKSLSLFI